MYICLHIYIYIYIYTIHLPRYSLTFFENNVPKKNGLVAKAIVFIRKPISCFENKIFSLENIILSKQVNYLVRNYDLLSKIFVPQ